MRRDDDKHERRRHSDKRRDHDRRRDDDRRRDRDGRRDHDSRRDRDGHSRDHDRHRDDRDRSRRDDRDRSRHDDRDRSRHDDKDDKRHHSQSKSDTFQEGFTRTKGEDEAEKLRKMQLETQDFNKVKISGSKDPKTDKKRDNKAKRIISDDGDDLFGDKQKRPKKKTKHEERLEMEQIKENLKAKQNKSYIPRDVFAEDRIRQEKEKLQIAKLKLEKEDKEAADAKKDGKDNKNKRRRIDESDDDTNFPQDLKVENIKPVSHPPKRIIDSPIEDEIPKGNFYV